MSPYVYVLLGFALTLCLSFVVLSGDARANRSSSSKVLRFFSTMMHSFHVCLDRLFAMLTQRWKLNEKKRQALKSLPDMIDLIILGLRAGLSFDGSFSLYCEQSNTELSKSCQLALLKWQSGISTRAEALNEMSDEYGLPALRSFSQSVLEALELGYPLADTLEKQAELIRTELKTELSEQIEKLPVKMLIPMGLLLVPALLLAVVGPLLAGAFISH